MGSTSVEEEAADCLRFLPADDAARNMSARRAVRDNQLPRRLNKVGRDTTLLQHGWSLLMKLVQAGYSQMIISGRRTRRWRVQYTISQAVD